MIEPAVLEIATGLGDRHYREPARAFVLLCRDAGLFAARLVALDGSKFRAEGLQMSDLVAKLVKPLG